MTLESQTPRVQNWRASSRSGSLRPVALIGGAVLVVGGLIYLVWSQSGGPSQAPAADTVALPAPDPLAGTADRAPSRPNRPEPVSRVAQNTPAGTQDAGTMRPSGGAPSRAPALDPDPAVAAAPGSIAAPGSVPAAPTLPTAPPGVTASTDALGAGSTPAPGPGVDPSPTSAPLASAELTAGGAGAGVLPAEVRDTIAAASRAAEAGRAVEARTLLNRALQDPRTPPPERRVVRQQISELNQSLVFSPTVSPERGDSIAEAYVIKAGDTLLKLVSRENLAVDWRALQRVNRLANPGQLKVGQRIKLLRGPFHAVVDKSEFRLDLYAGDAASPGSAGSASGPDGQEPGWTFIASFPVGLGEHGSTPLGTFVVRPKSKLVNPAWTNPRTGEKFAADDPKNPIGERWLGLMGVEERTRAVEGYGLHGTVEPDSIGRERSMGCVRMRADDIALVYDLLVERVSTVRIVE